MSTRLRKLKLTGVMLVAGLALPAGIGLALAAEQPSEEQILRALKPRVTRSLTMSPAEQAKAAEQARFIDTLRNRRTRSLSSDERDMIQTVAKERPQIDLEINFDYNSAAIGSKASSSVNTLGKALSNPDLKGSTFVLAGHTDAKGGDVYNQDLSERRADAVKKFLMEKYGIEPDKLVTVGYGKTQLKDSGHPFAAENRRVQIVNMADK
jgi:outer membrane protein OmpA-like peptidoglycan-associated protein